MVLVLALGLVPGWARAGTGVFVNGFELDAVTVERLETVYSSEVLPARYWYDRRSGLWGLVGGPGIGQLAAGLALGGPLAYDASGGMTRVVVNNRALHPRELDWLRGRYGEVRPGRYWLDASGVAGFEGGPAQFDLRAGAGGYNRNTPGGALMNDGRCAGYLHPDGPSVMVGDC
ncbi:hypothetical protein HFP89_00450 [Wenzhouxiangella sp. XN79A]|uniref:hypothetical protein n=1 Tax=Wenzhouxiangella sp. XN79A TaxID=2724193 RepID=UPI00144AF3EF|nr:hypothetical protein [Wenzhouxiangella sp. XN79A]NKI33633.1 hypothetical protein [Wenzhouxiangella sp. XN79A]